MKTGRLLTFTPLQISVCKKVLSLITEKAYPSQLEVFGTLMRTYVMKLSVMILVHYAGTPIEEQLINMITDATFTKTLLNSVVTLMMKTLAQMKCAAHVEVDSGLGSVGIQE